ncbi:MAG: hypothetical protein WBP08_00725 [Saprospiraceae bacterium]
MAEIDVKSLSKKQQLELVFEILKNNIDLRTEFQKIVSNESEDLSLDYIEKLILQDFEIYDEVFRKLA